jgi:branched-subunit amino acid transport protein
MAVVTYLTRVSFLLLAGRVSLPRAVETGLKYIPVGIITGLVVPALLVVDGRVNVSMSNPYLPAGIVSALLAARFKNVLLAMCGGVAVVVLLRLSG